jgi:hypothetical protein
VEQGQKSGNPRNENPGIGLGCHFQVMILCDLAKPKKWEFEIRSDATAK